MQRTVRSWSVSGLATADDVVELQAQVKHYSDLLMETATAVDKAGKLSHVPSAPHSAAQWSFSYGRAQAYAQQDPPLFFPGSMYDQGRALIGELDGWRDYFASTGTPNVPDAVPVPKSQVTLGDIGLNLQWVAMAVVAFLAWHEFGRRG